MTVAGGTVVPRSQISLGLDRTVRTSLAQRANGRVLVIDYFAGRRCSVVIGDLTAGFEDALPGRGYVELASIERVPVFAEERLIEVLGSAGPTLTLGGPPFARHLAVHLDRPERWIDFLERPGVLAGKNHVRWRRRRAARRGP